MRVAQRLYKDGEFGAETGDRITGEGAILILGFGSKDILLQNDIYNKLNIIYPDANIVLCSTAGEIYDSAVYDDSVSIVIMEFEDTLIKTACVNIGDGPDSFETGRGLFNKLNADGLSYMMVISDGGLVNGSELVRGIEDINRGKIPVTGGLAGDGDKFNYTIVGCNEAPAIGNVVAVGFYGKSLKIGHGSLAGWEIFGPEKKITRAVSNRLFEIDNKSALELYKQYLGKYADDLPGSALLFPLYVRHEGSQSAVVRTILSIDEKEQCMIFAGDVPEGSLVRFMKANFDKLIDAASHAANNALTQFRAANASKPKLALLISCVGRKLILGNRIDEEIEAVKEIFGDNTLLSGFYAYGEISPLVINTKCNLHNQTMTITTFDEEATSIGSS